MQSSIGLLGGTFNPIHNGHIAMAEAARAELSLDELIIMPTGDPPHKSAELADRWDRLRMAELAAGGRFAVSAMEVERPGKTYTIDTLEALREKHPGKSIVMLIGGDTLREIASWREAERVFTMCRFAVFGRGELPLQAITGADVIRLSALIPDISATEIRARVHQGLSLDGLAPSAVVDYIGAKRLYNPPPRMRHRLMRERLLRTLPAKRYIHTRGVEHTMRVLAKRFAYDTERAALTGLLHDCAKGMTLDEMRALVAGAGMLIDEERTQTRELLHAPAGVQLAREVYGVTDPEILHAIYYHNTGCVPMGTLDELLWVADMTEPGRRGNEAIAHLRKLSKDDLKEAARETLRMKLQHVEQQGKQAHPDTAAALEALTINCMEGTV